MSDQKRNPSPLLIIGGAALVAGFVIGGITFAGLGDSPDPYTIQADLASERTEAFVAGLCNGQSPCEGRLQVKTAGDSAMEEYRITMNRLYNAYSGQPVTVSTACTRDRYVLGNTCEFIPDEPPVTAYNPATAVK